MYVCFSYLLLFPYLLSIWYRLLECGASVGTMSILTLFPIWLFSNCLSRGVVSFQEESLVIQRTFATIQRVGANEIVMEVL
jgi:hypothetical protein